MSPSTTARRPQLDAGCRGGAGIDEGRPSDGDDPSRPTDCWCWVLGCFLIDKWSGGEPISSDDAPNTKHTSWWSEWVASANRIKHLTPCGVAPSKVNPSPADPTLTETVRPEFAFVSAEVSEEALVMKASVSPDDVLRLPRITESESPWPLRLSP